MPGPAFAADQRRPVQGRNKIHAFRPECTECACIRTCARIVFVVGCGHSGTTYMTRVLGAHPRYHIIPRETSWFRSMYNGTAVRGRPATPRTLHQPPPQNAYDDFRGEAVACAYAGKSVLVEKTPTHVLHIPAMLARFPEARIVMMVRDGRDVTASLVHRWGREATSPCIDAYRYVTDNRRVLEQNADPRTLLVRYEDLIRDPGRTVCVPPRCAAACAGAHAPRSDRIFRHTEGQDAPPEVHRVFASRGDVRWGKVAPVDAKPEADADVEGKNKQLRNWQMNQPLFDGSRRWVRPLEEGGLSDAHLDKLFACRGRPPAAAAAPLRRAHRRRRRRLQTDDGQAWLHRPRRAPRKLDRPSRGTRAAAAARAVAVARLSLIRRRACAPRSCC